MKLLALVGSGEARARRRLLERVPRAAPAERGCTVVGIELDETGGRGRARGLRRGARRRRGDDGAPLSRGSFDVVLCGDLIEHLRAPERFLARVRPLLRDGGRLVLTTPNVANWTMRLGLLAGRWRYTERGILDRTHPHLFTRRHARRDARECGLPDRRARPHRPGTRCRSTVRGTGRPHIRAPAAFALRLPVRGRRDARPMISVVIPVKDGGLDLVRCLEAIARQQVDEEVEVVVIDSGSTDGSAERARRLGARVHEIRPEEFSHGGAAQPRRRAGARRDPRLHLAGRLRRRTSAGSPRLVAPLRERDEVAGVYGRQLPHDDAIPSERYFLDFLYGPEPRTQRLVDPDRAQLRRDALLERELRSAARRAGALSARHRRDHERGPGVVAASPARGLEIVYEPRAAVRHSHAYTVASAFRRFFDSGVSADRAYVSEAPSSRVGAAPRPALRYALGEVAWLWRTGHRRWLPYAAVYESAKFAGLQLGLRHQRIPLPLKRRLLRPRGTLADDEGRARPPARDVLSRESASSTTISSRRRSEGRNGGCATWRSTSPRPVTT